MLCYWFLTSFNGSLLFFADDGSHGYELWRSDGTAVGTTLVKDIFPGAASSLTFAGPPLVGSGGRAFFIANDVTCGYRGGSCEPDTAAGLVYLGNTLFFIARLSDTWGLWTSDGTVSGTVALATLNPEQLTPVGGHLLFSADDGVHGSELWTSDGSVAGTHLVKDIWRR